MTKLKKIRNLGTVLLFIVLFRTKLMNIGGGILLLTGLVTNKEWKIRHAQMKSNEFDIMESGGGQRGKYVTFFSCTFF